MIVTKQVLSGPLFLSLLSSRTRAALWLALLRGQPLFPVAVLGLHAVFFSLGGHARAQLCFVFCFVLEFHQTALRSELPDGAELVLAHFKNCLDETPYCVAVDHTWQSIIITIRGTHSFEVGGKWMCVNCKLGT